MQRKLLGKLMSIGNLNSQVLANFYLDCFDHFIKRDSGIQYYNRYVDDFVIVHRDKAYLKSIRPKIAEYKVFIKSLQYFSLIIIKHIFNIIHHKINDYSCTNFGCNSHLIRNFTISYESSFLFL
jgi:hypothetical protein